MEKIKNMKRDQKILDEFGKQLIHTVYDFNYKLLKQAILHLNKKGAIVDNLDFLCSETFESVLFNILNFFEENEQFKIVYEEEGKQVNLVEISEMLKAEIHGEDGWIMRFSEEFKKENNN